MLEQEKIIVKEVFPGVMDFIVQRMAEKVLQISDLKKSEHIAKVLIDPRDSKVIYVAAQGPLWGPGGDRGLYKSTDYGATWDSVLYISPNTGVTDVAMDPRDPDVLYAASYQRRRHVWTFNKWRT